VAVGSGKLPPMELHEAIRRRAMVRSFASDPTPDPALIDTLVEAALRAPSAGNTGGTAWVVLSGPDETARYWSATTDASWRESSPRSAGLRRAPVILLAYASASAYVARYAEPDKATSDPSLGSSEVAWPVPYWIGDAAFGVMTVLLAAVDAGLGACVLGNFRGEEELAGALGVPASWRLFCAVPVGYPDGNDHRSPSLSRATPPLSDRIHRGRWGA
jgi:nitroreductase